jgi:UDP-N-acetylmuramyl pentapeptide phosphotransferase/UDP-N-acetylglucosamine-1-phosphate transferase
MHALPFLLGLVSAVLLAPALLRMLAQGGHVKANYRGRELPFPFGALVLCAALLALIPVVLVQRLGSADVIYPELGPVALYALGVIVLGLIDDTLGEPRTGEPARRGWRGHGAALLRGELSTGILKAVGSLSLAMLAMAALGYRSNWRWLLATAVLLLATNAFNLLDLRPGRAGKAFVLLGVGLSIGAASLRQLWTLGLFAAPALVAGLYDLRERAMLGDTGANLLGALAGLWLVLTLSATGQLIALILLAALTVYGELRSISGFVERTPGLRHLDSLGRPA